MPRSGFVHAAVRSGQPERSHLPRRRRDRRAVVRREKQCHSAARTLRSLRSPRCRSRQAVRPRSRRCRCQRAAVRRREPPEQQRRTCIVGLVGRRLGRLDRGRVAAPRLALAVRAAHLVRVRARVRVRVRVRARTRAGVRVRLRRTSLTASVAGAATGRQQGLQPHAAEAATCGPSPRAAAPPPRAGRPGGCCTAEAGHPARCTRAHAHGMQLGLDCRDGVRASMLMAGWRWVCSASSSSGSDAARAPA
eukprot:scaffold101256_cov72-Phaeocystis_antarctica.AAC.1